MPPTIRQGATGEPVREAQYLLARRHDLGARDIDGQFGPHTDQVVRAFQQASGLAADGTVGPATWGALLTGFAVPPTLGDGSRGDVVRRLQQVLDDARASFGIAHPPIAVDGSYGPATAGLVTAYQRTDSLTADGIVGPQTWAMSMHAAGAELAGLVGV